MQVQETPVAELEPAPLHDALNASALTSALLAGLALTACGGGDDAGGTLSNALPSAFANPSQAPIRREILQGREAPAVAATAVRLPTATELMDWAERNFSAYFPGHKGDLQSAPYTYRFYPETGNYVGISGAAIYILGPVSGGPLAFVGTLNDYATAVLAAVQAFSDEEAARFLLQAQFSASDAEIAAVRAMGYVAWLDEQLSLPASTGGWDWLSNRGYAVADDNRYYVAAYPGDFMIWQQLMESADAARKRLALALSEFFVVSLSGLGGNWRYMMLANYWDTLVKHTSGNFRDLLQAITLDPAMGQYLNTRGNQKEDAASGRQPDENYAREVMQLFTIGLVQLNLDGTPKTDASGKPIETYGANDVSNLARVFTGYDYDYSTSTRVITSNGDNPLDVPFTRLPMRATESRHSVLAASFLGTTIAANTSSSASLRIALDALFNHPNVGPFFGQQMIQRLVTSNPSPAYVARVASVFNNNGTGVRGDLIAVFRAVLLDDEARTAAGLTHATWGKLREPMMRLLQWGRSFGITSARGSWKMADLSDAGTELSQSPLRSPSVFNFFRPGFVPPSTALAATGRLAPEFQLVNESSVSSYLNYMQGVIRNGIFVRGPDVLRDGANTAANGYDVNVTYARELALVTDTRALVGRLNLLLCAGQLSAETQTLVVNALNATSVTAASTSSAKLDRIASAVLLVMASAEYLVQK